ncbi:MAG: RluA family pseudouridine synthase [Clostridia bacterium]|nr:RluA family pseudouridine synthase [Clostridia bacterium]
MIIYEDNEIVVCIKPKGLISQEGAPGTQSMVAVLGEKCACQIYPVHRLDKDVSGVMVYAKTQKAAGVLSKQVSDRTMKKNYLAVTAEGDIAAEGTMEDLLFFDKQRNKSFIARRERKGVKKAILHYRLVKTVNGRSLYSVRLETGRTHQIRVQFASRKMPLVGDRKYGSKENCDIGLYSTSISFIHPLSGEAMLFTSKPCEGAFESFKDI